MYDIKSNCLFNHCGGFLFLDVMFGAGIIIKVVKS